MTILSQRPETTAPRIDRGSRSRRLLQRLPALTSIAGLWGAVILALFLVGSFVASAVGSWAIGVMCTGLVALPIVVALSPNSRGRRG